MLLQKISLLKLSELKRQRCPDTPTYAEYGVLRIITPTDSVKDRLAAYYHWKDDRSLEQAILVATKHEVDFESIRKWSVLEDSEDKFEEFIRLFNKR